MHANGDAIYVAKIALDIATLLQTYFPEEFEAHVAPRHLSRLNILKAIVYFVRLANDYLLDIHIDALCGVFPDIMDLFGTQNIDDIMYALPEGNEWEPSDTIIEDMAAWVYNPLPMMYGCPEVFCDANILAVALWALAELTGYCRYTIAQGIQTLSPEWKKRIAKIKRLQSSTNIHDLCWCTWNYPLNIDGDWALGDIVAYVFKSTDNEFADYENFEIDHDDAFEDIFAHPAIIQEIRMRQIEAQYYHDVYRALNEAVLAQPRLLNIIITELHQEAARHAGNAHGHQSNKLIDILHDYLEEEDETYAYELELA